MVQPAVARAGEASFDRWNAQASRCRSRASDHPPGPRRRDQLHLRQKGTRISIDDTGSGYSSLAHILKLAPDLIKLDRDLVSGIDVDPVRRALAAALVSFAAETGTQVVAEGVETEDELVVLRQLGVRYAQGYYLGRPAGLDTLAAAERQPWLLKG